MSKIKIDSYTSIYVKTTGTGFPLVFLHGNGEDHQVFYSQFEYFKDKYKLILIDTRMHGKSTAPYKKYDFNTLALDVLLVLRNLNITSAYFIGFSDGANILIHIALLNKDIIRKGVLISGNLYPSGMKFRYLLGIKLMRLSYMLKARKNKNYQFYLMTRNPRLKFKDLDDISNDFLIIAGENDYVKDSHTKKIHHHLNGSKLEIIKNGTHFSVSEKSEEVNKLIDDYLKG